LTVYEEGSEDEEFWKALGDKGPIAPSGPEPVSKDKFAGKKSLHRLSDASGKLEFKEVAVGVIKHSLLDEKDVFIFDIGAEVFAWVGLKTSKAERSNALQYAQDYVIHSGKDPNLPIAKILQGAENEIFLSAFDS